MAAPPTPQDYSERLPHTKVSFETRDGITLRGNLFVATTNSSSIGPRPLIIFTHGIGLVKEQYLENWIRPLLAHGYHCVSYDHRCFGESDGWPRERFDWRGQAEDLIDVVVQVRDGKDWAVEGLMVDGEKVFVWGVAHSGTVAAMWVLLRVTTCVGWRRRADEIVQGGGDEWVDRGRNDVPALHRWEIRPESLGSSALRSC
jgi:pimeloyl-ACP methyl ester carboxylesterase